jgi:hypothetical protein
MSTRHAGTDETNHNRRKIMVRFYIGEFHRVESGFAFNSDRSPRDAIVFSNLEAVLDAEGDDIERLDALLCAADREFVRSDCDVEITLRLNNV